MFCGALLFGLFGLFGLFWPFLAFFFPTTTTTTAIAEGMLDLLTRCTALAPNHRPGFNEVCRQLEEISRLAVLTQAREERLEQERKQMAREAWEVRACVRACVRALF